MSFKEKFSLFPVVETARLVLRQPRPGDRNEYYHVGTDPEVLKYMGMVSVLRSPEMAERHIEHLSHAFGRQQKVAWAITFRGEDRLIGTIQLGNFTRGSMADVGYSLGRMYWGRGIMTEALRAATRCGFEYFGLHRIQATVMPENAASYQVADKVGYTREGLLREYIFGEGFCDCYIYSILAYDFPAVRSDEVYNLTLAAPGTW